MTQYGEVVYPPGRTLGPRTQSFFQLVFLLRGQCRIRIDEKEYLIDPGNAFLLIPGRDEFFAFDPQKPTEHTWLHFQWRGEPPELPGGMPVLPFVVALTPRMTSLMRLGIDSQRPENPQESCLLCHLAECIWLEFLAQRPDDFAATPPLHPAVGRVQDYIDIHWREELTLGALARHGHVTPRHLIRLFRQHLDQTPIQYLWNLRLTRAIGLLQSSGLRIGEIADQTGFQSPAHFARAIKEKTGLTPRALRDRHWNK